MKDENYIGLTWKAGRWYAEVLTTRLNNEKDEPHLWVEERNDEDSRVCEVEIVTCP